MLPKMARYTVASWRCPRGTAGAAKLGAQLRTGIQEIGGVVHETYVYGPYACLSASMTQEMRQEVETWHGVESVHQQFGDIG